MRESIDLVDLFHHRWAVPALAEMSASGAARVVMLREALGASRGGLSQALDALVALGLARRNPGHGHPLRPEYLLTSRGIRCAGHAERIVRLSREWSIEEATFRKWPLPVAHNLRNGARFGELRLRLPGITDRALSEALKVLSSSGLVVRTVHPSHPPAVEYVPALHARELLIPLGHLSEAA